jgi:RimJ/RimL family protein N-acetyltransferase
MGCHPINDLIVIQTNIAGHVRVAACRHQDIDNEGFNNPVGLGTGVAQKPADGRCVDDGPTMAMDQTVASSTAWRTELPVLTGRTVTLREPCADDLGPLIDLLSLSDATHFGLDEPISDISAQQLIDRAVRDRAAGLSFMYAITQSASHAVVGLFQVRQLDPTFEAAEWECTLTPSSRGSGVFLEAARLIGSFAFGTIGTYRMEARVLLRNGRANGALRKLGAVQEGLLRRAVRRNSEYFDQVLWSLLRDDWRDHWVSTAARVH